MVTGLLSQRSRFDSKPVNVRLVVVVLTRKEKGPKHEKIPKLMMFTK